MNASNLVARGCQKHGTMAHERLDFKGHRDPRRSLQSDSLVAWVGL